MTHAPNAESMSFLVSVRSTFLQRPDGGAGVVADAVRVVGLLSLLVIGLHGAFVDVAVMSLVLLGLLVPRFLGVRPALDLLCGLSLLVAGWSSIADLYVTVRWWDLPVHFVLNGAMAALLLVLLDRLRVLTGVVAAPPVGRILVTTAFGTTLGVLWEFGEWVGHTFVDASVYVGYDDTLGDLLWGGAGSALAGLVLGALAARGRWITTTNEPTLSHPSAS